MAEVGRNASACNTTVIRHTSESWPPVKFIWPIWSQANMTRVLLSHLPIKIIYKEILLHDLYKLP